MSNIKSIVRLRTDNEVDLDVKYFAKDDSLVDTYMDLGELLDYINELEENRDKVREYIETKEKDDDNWVDYELLIEPIRIKEIIDKGE